MQNKQKTNKFKTTFCISLFNTHSGHTVHCICYPLISQLSLVCIDRPQWN